MIELSNGIKFNNTASLRTFIIGLGYAKRKINYPAYSNSDSHFTGQRYAKSAAIAAIDAAIENAELALKSAQRKEDKMKTAKKPAVKAVKKPVVKKAVKKPVAKKK